MQLSILEYLSLEERQQFMPVESEEWNWTFANYPKEKNGLKVFSCFACGGGSTMGYKLAGCDVLGCCEIDKKSNKVYVKNHKPKYNYCEDLRAFNARNDLPDELYHLDILDGSPPCSAFSLSGDREDVWGKEKPFREGQAAQILDELPFVFVETVNKLRPKVVIMENVVGILQGNAIAIAQQITMKFLRIGYKVRVEIFKAEKMGVPQARHRVFFIATRLDFDLYNIDFNFNYKPILYREVKAGIGRDITDNMRIVLDEVKPGEKKMSFAWNRLYNTDNEPKAMYFNNIILYEDEVLPTITTTHGNMFDYKDKRLLSDETIINACTFPQDYDFCGVCVGYICGMSVPPLMMKRIFDRLIQSGIFDF